MSIWCAFIHGFTNHQFGSYITHDISCHKMQNSQSCYPNYTAVLYTLLQTLRTYLPQSSYRANAHMIIIIHLATSTFTHSFPQIHFASPLECSVAIRSLAREMCCLRECVHACAAEMTVVAEFTVSYCISFHRPDPKFQEFWKLIENTHNKLWLQICRTRILPMTLALLISLLYQHSKGNKKKLNKSGL